MLLVLLRQSFANQKRAMAVMVASVAMGTAISASLITISLDITGKVARELRSFGANVVIEPRVEGFADIAGERRYLRVEDLPRAKTIFWRHNILGLAPFLDAEVELQAGGTRRTVPAIGTWIDRRLPLPGEQAEFQVGTVTVLPWWEVRGAPPEGGSVLLGESLAADLGLHAGDTVLVGGRSYAVSGTLATGEGEDRSVIFGLEELQRIVGREGAVSRVLVSALTTPMDAFAYKDPTTMTKAEYEKWYCTGYVTSISKQLEEVFQGGRAKPIWKVAASEGTVLGRMSVLVYLLTAATLVAAAIGMSTTMAASILRRLEEIGLMKALGADRMRIVGIFLVEALVIGLAGGLIGYLFSLGVSDWIGMRVFSTAIEDRGMLLPASLLSALGIAVAGSLLPIRRALNVQPAVVLKWAR
jgi:putative ABC transport system permease protein